MSIHNCIQLTYISSQYNKPSPLLKRLCFSCWSLIYLNRFLVSGRGQKRAAESLELELELTVSGNMGVGNSTWDLLEDLSGALNH